MTSRSLQRSRALRSDRTVVEIFTLPSMETSEATSRWMAWIAETLSCTVQRIACCTQAILYGVRWMPCQSIAMRSKGLSSSASGCAHDRSALLLRTLFEHLCLSAQGCLWAKLNGECPKG